MELEKQGKKVTKISVIGYSLGGLVARYAIGLLYTKGYFDRMEPVVGNRILPPLHDSSTHANKHRT